MDKRTTAIVATVVTALLCGCPGLVILCLGAFAVPTSFMSGPQPDIAGINNSQSLLTTGIVGLCLGILLIAIPVVVGFTTLRNQPAAAGMVVPPAPPRPPTDFVPPPAPSEPAPAEPGVPPAPPAEPDSEAGTSPETQVEPPAESSAEKPAEPPAEPPAPEDDDAIPPAI
jgi:hypothetical protein